MPLGYTVQLTWKAAIGYAVLIQTIQRADDTWQVKWKVDHGHVDDTRDGKGDGAFRETVLRITRDHAPAVTDQLDEDIQEAWGPWDECCGTPVSLQPDPGRKECRRRVQDQD